MRLSSVFMVCCTFLPFINGSTDSLKKDYVHFYDKYLTEEKAELDTSGSSSSPTPSPGPTPPSPPPPSPPPPSPPPPSPPPPSPVPSPAEPLLNHAPIIIVNNTGLDADRIYFLGTGSNLANTSAHFLKPNLSTGVCTYASPETFDSADPTISVRLSDLPTSGIDSYLIYIPQQISGRCYLSVDAPLYLQTTETTIGSPSVTNPSDPNYYTLYQNFELTLDASYNLYANVSNVDFFSLPMGLASFTYPSGNPYPTVSTPSLTASGFAESTSRSSILTSMTSALTTNDPSSPAQWNKLLIPFYDNPYTDATALTDLRILAAKDSITFATTAFSGALHPQGAFNSLYLQSGTTGPSVGNSYMQDLGLFYTGTSLTFSIYPASQPEATYTMTTAAGTSAILHLAAISGVGATNVNLNLNNLTTLALLGGDVSTWNTDGVFDPPGTNVWYTEIAKLLSALFSAGQLPTNITQLTQPVISAQTYFQDKRSYYFSNPISFLNNGPWYNLYDASMHPLMVLTGGSGLGYAYDYDDLLALGGEMQVVIQTGSTLNSDAPYYELLVAPIDTPIPDPTSAFGPYTLIVNAIGAGKQAINIIYSTTPSGAPTTSVAVPVSPAGPITLSSLYNYFEVEYADQAGKIYKVYPKHQLVLPITTSYTATDADLMSEISFVAVTVGGTSFTISLPSLAP